MTYSDFPKNEANYVPLSPLSFLKRSARIFPDHPSIVYGERRYTWAETYGRACRLASALQAAGIDKGDVVAFLAANTPELYEAHFGVPMAGATLNALNCRLDAASIGYILDHSDASVLITDREFSDTAKGALDVLGTNRGRDILVIDIYDPAYAPVAEDRGDLLGEQDYESFISGGDPDFVWQGPADEWDTISINYTSGTTGSPKGVVYHHRGAYMNAIGNAMEWDMPQHPTYLWTLPMFHCNGWCFPWTLAAKAGTSVCIRKVTAKNIFDGIADYGVDHLCGAPIVLSFMINADDNERREFDHNCKVMTAAAPPPASVLRQMAEQGFAVTHVYGLTETYGPSAVCAWHQEWDELPIDEQAGLKARQGVPYVLQEDIMVADPETMVPVPQDGATLGEVFFRGNIAMKGYLKNAEATAEAFAGGWFHSGDLGVWYAGGYVQLKDRSKDIIISGGENISSIEVEDALYRHPAIGAVAVVAKPDEKWGETPCAFVELKAGAESVSEADLIAFCRDNLAHFKCPRVVVFDELPKTSTGKIQKFVLRERAREF